MILKKSIRTAISVFLLLCFAAAAVPVDFLHDHASESVCGDIAKHSSCHHKLHLTKKTPSCFACSAHFDKSFIPAAALQEIEVVTVSSIAVRRNVGSVTLALTLSSLRGPPSS